MERTNWWSHPRMGHASGVDLHLVNHNIIASYKSCYVLSLGQQYFNFWPARYLIWVVRSPMGAIANLDPARTICLSWSDQHVAKTRSSAHNILCILWVAISLLNQSNAQYYVVVYANDHEATKQPILTWTNDDSLLTHTRSYATKRLTDI